LRKGRVSLPGQIYFVTTVVRDRGLLFLSPNLARVACCTLDAHSTTRGLEILCWVLMPDHMHLLVCLQEGDLSKRIGYLKARMAHAVNRERNMSEPVWEHGFHEHALRSEEDLPGVGRYIVANPVRAGLVKSVGMYPYWNAVWL